MSTSRIELKNEPETITISRAAAVLGFSRNKIRALMKSGDFRSHKIGGRYYLLRDELSEDLKK